MNDLKSSDSVTTAVYTHPLTYLLMGGMFSLVWMLSSVRPSSFYLWLIGFFVLTFLGLCGISSHTWHSRISLMLLGAGILGMYGLIRWLPGELLREQLLYRTVHLEGTYDGAGNFQSEKINNRSISARFYLPRYNLSENQQIQTPGRYSLRLTADVRWPYKHKGFASYLEKQGLIGILEPLRIHALSPEPGNDFGIYSGIKSTLLEKESRWPQSVSFLRALVLGEKQGLDPHDQTVFKRLGIIHLFVISGLHVGIFFVLVRGLFQWLSPGWRFVVLTLVLAGYLWFLGWPISATRAGLMLFLWQLAEFMGRRTSPWSYLWTAVLVMILWEPSVVQQVGFQLTVSAVIGIYAVLDYTSSLKGWFGFDYALVSTGAFFGVMPVVLYHFHYIPSAGLLFSFLAMFLFWFFLGILGLQALLISLNWTVLADSIEFALRWSMDGLASIASRRMDITVTGILPWTVLLLGIGLWWMLDHSRNRSLRVCSVGMVLLILVGVAGSGISAHGELGLLQEEAPFFVHKDRNGHTLAIVPPHVRLESHHVNDLGDQLRAKGIRHLDRLISDYPRELFQSLNPEFTVGRYLVHWREEGIHEWDSGTYDFRENKLRINQVNLHFNLRKDVPIKSYSPTRWVGYVPERYCLVNRLEQLSEPVYRHLQSRDCLPVILREKSFWIYVPGNGSVKPPQTFTVEQWYLHLLGRGNLV